MAKPLTLATMNAQQRKVRVAHLIATGHSAAVKNSAYLPASVRAARARQAGSKGNTLATMSPSERVARVNHLAATHNTAAIKDSKYLPEKYRKVREANLFDQQPVTPGSSLTNQDLRRQRHAAETLQFGANPVGASQDREKQVGSYYDQYLTDLRQASANTNTFATQANTASQSLQTGAPQASDTANLSPENLKAVQNAAAIRSALLGSAGQEIASLGKNASVQADQTANVVGPGEKLVGMDKAAKATKSVRDQVGAFRTKYNADRLGVEQQNALAQSIGQDKSLADIEKAAAADRASRRTANTQRANNAADAKLGAARFGETVRHNTASEKTAAANADTAAKKAAQPAKTKTKKSPWVTTGQYNSAVAQIGSIQKTASRLASGLSKDPNVAKKQRAGKHDKHPLDRAAIGRELQSGYGIESTAVLSAVLDSLFSDHGRPKGVLSPATVRALIRQGYKPSKIAAELHVKTAGQYGPYPSVKAPPKKQTSTSSPFRTPFSG